MRARLTPLNLFLALAAVMVAAGVAALAGWIGLVPILAYLGAAILCVLIAIGLGRLVPILRTTKGRVGAALAVATIIVHVAAVQETGFTDDDDFYIGAGRLYMSWFMGTGQFTAGSKLDRANVDRAWNCRYPCNPEHPWVAKASVGVGRWLLYDVLKVTGEIRASQLGVAFMATLLLLLVFSIAWDELSPTAGVMSAVFLLFMPRFFFDSHIPTLDVPAATTYFLAAYAFWYGLRSHTWGIAAGFAFGLALLTKLNAPFAAIPIGIYFLYHLRSQIRLDGGLIRLGGIPWNLPAMLIIGPLMFFLLWPRLWYGTFDNLKWWLEFHMRHYGILFYYQGTIFDQDPFAPWHAAIVTTAITTPLVTYALSLVGTVGAIAANVRRRLADADARRRDFLLFILLNAFVTIGILIFLNAPLYGGVKLFLPFFPFLAILAGHGFACALDALNRVIKSMRFLRYRAAALGLFVAAPAAIEIAYHHPYGLSYYSPLIGGTRGATQAGYERHYYDIFYKDLVRWLNDLAKDRDLRVTFLPNNKEYQRSAPWLQGDAQLSRRVSIGGLWDSDVLVLTHERRWPQYPDLFRALSRLDPIMDLRVEGVSLATAYAWRRGAAFNALVR